MIVYDRKKFFDKVRSPLFHGSMNQAQVDGMTAILDGWEARYPEGDTRHLGYCLATTFHETAQEMQPIEEYGRGAGQPYGEVDPETGQTYFGRGFVQLTWRDNYARADRELGYAGNDSCEWHAQRALDPEVASEVMFRGMEQGWFRSDGNGPHTLSRHFHDEHDDPFNAREIINGDKLIVPEWSAGVNIGNLIKDYYMDFTMALNAARREVRMPVIEITVVAPPGVQIVFIKKRRA